MKKIMLNILLVIILFNISTAIAKDNINFGIIDYQGKDYQGVKNSYGNPMLREDQPFKTELKKVLSELQTDISYESFSSNGEKTSVLLTSKILEPNGGIGESLFRFSPRTNNTDLPILFWDSKEITPTLVKYENVEISDEQLQFFKSEIHKLFNAALKPLRDQERKIFDISKPEIKKPSGSNLAFIYFPITLDRSSENATYFDDRASAFFLYDMNEKRIIKSRFGHPEWSTGGDEVETIKPILFFEMEGKLYSFCEYAGSWEYSGYAIMKAHSGKITMKSF